MSRSINGDGSSSTGAPMVLMDQTLNTQYVFDGELVLCKQAFVDPVTVKVDINLLYSWVNCTRASRFYLHVGDSVISCGVGDSVTHLNHIEKIVIVGTPAASELKVVLRKDAKADDNDTIELKRF